MKLIERYIIKRIILLFFSILLACLAIFWIIEILGKINIVTANKASIAQFIYLSIMLIPSILVTVIPLALAITTAHSLHGLNQDSEMVIIANAGSGRKYIWRPIILMGIIASIIVFILANFIVPVSRMNMRRMIAETSANFIANVMRSDNFISIQKNLYMKIGKRTVNSDVNDIFIADERKPNTTSYYYAQQAHIVKNLNYYFLVMNNGVIIRYNKLNNENSIAKFHSYSLELSNFTRNEAQIHLYPKDLSLNFLLNHAPDDTYYVNNQKSCFAELHYRLTSWLFSLIFILIALITAGSPTTHREAKSRFPTSITIFFSIAIYLLYNTLKNKSHVNEAYIAILYVIPLIVIFYAFAVGFFNVNLNLTNLLMKPIKKLISTYKSKKNTI